MDFKKSKCEKSIENQFFRRYSNRFPSKLTPENKKIELSIFIWFFFPIPFQLKSTLKMIISIFKFYQIKNRFFGEYRRFSKT